MISNTDICNLALSHLGQKTITSLTENTVSANKCNLFYEIARDTVLRDHPWNFATRIVELAEIADAVTTDDELVTGWDYIYLYPPSALYIRRIFSDDATEFVEPDKFKEVLSATTKTKAIAADVSPAYCEYIEKVTDVSKYDTSFNMALSYMLASQLAQPLTGDTNLANRMFSMYQLSIDKAKYNNATEGNEKVRSSNSYVDAR